MKSGGFGDWVREHVFGLVSVISMMVGMAYQYGAMGNKLSVQNDRLADLEKKQDIGHPDIRNAFDKRISALEVRTDNLSRLEQVVSNQTDQIKSLADIVSKDHDILLKIVSVLDKR